jgi:hypothetical protein
MSAQLDAFADYDTDGSLLMHSLKLLTLALLLSLVNASRCLL